MALDTARHENIPEVGRTYRVNGTEMVVMAVTNSPQYHTHVSMHPCGNFVYCARRLKNGRGTKSVTMFRNSANHPSWYDQDMVAI